MLRATIFILVIICVESKRKDDNGTRYRFPF